MAEPVQLSDADLLSIAVEAVRQTRYKPTIPFALCNSLAIGLLIHRGILPLGDRAPRLAKILFKEITGKNY